MTATLFELRRLSFQYEQTPILREVSLSVHQGDFIAILGPNGAGKSTLIKLFSGAITPTSGEIYFQQKPLGSLSRRLVASQIAVMPQETAASFSFTALEVVLFGRFPHQDGFGFAASKDVEIAERALAEVDALHLSSRLISSLSGGEKQRVFLAKAIAQDPKVLLLDEPTAHLDLGHQSSALRAASVRARRGAVIAVLHDCNIAALYASRILLLAKGELIADGAPNEVLTQENVSRCFGHRVEVLPRRDFHVPAILPVKD